MSDPLASPADVRLEYDSKRVSDSQIETLLEKKARAIDRDSDVPGLDEDDRRDLEALLAAIHIATKLDRAPSSHQAGNAQKSYEESVVDQLRADARRLGATEELLGIGATKPQANFEVF